MDGNGNFRISVERAAANGTSKKTSPRLSLSLSLLIEREVPVRSSPNSQESSPDLYLKQTKVGENCVRNTEARMNVPSVSGLVRALFVRPQSALLSSPSSYRATSISPQKTTEEQNYRNLAALKVALS